MSAPCSAQYTSLLFPVFSAPAYGPAFRPPRGRVYPAAAANAANTGR